MPEDSLQLFQVHRGNDPEHAASVKATVRYQDMAVGVESQEVAKGLDGDDGAGDGILLRHRNVNSTFIYTQVDFETLKQLPLDWPEV